MRVVCWICVLMSALSGLAYAQEKPASETAPRAGGFFRSKRVSFWGDAGPEKPEAPAGQVESLWAEPIRLPDGRMTVYVPPKQVLAFLETPNEESGKAYLAWQKERMEKMARAAEILARLSGRAIAPPKNEPLPGSHPEPAATLGAPSRRDQAGEKADPALSPNLGRSGAKPEELLYFKREGCPHCNHQDPEIAALLKERPNLKLKVLMPGEEDDVWKAFGVEVVPTLIATRSDGKKIMAKGFTPKAALIRALSVTQGESK